MPVPQKKITLVGWASCPSHQLRKRIFARGLLSRHPPSQQPVANPSIGLAFIAEITQSFTNLNGGGSTK